MKSICSAVSPLVSSPVAVAASFVQASPVVTSPPFWSVAALPSQSRPVAVSTPVSSSWFADSILLLLVVLLPLRLFNQVLLLLRHRFALLLLRLFVVRSLLCLFLKSNVRCFGNVLCLVLFVVSVLLVFPFRCFFSFLPYFVDVILVCFGCILVANLFVGWVRWLVPPCGVYLLPLHWNSVRLLVLQSDSLFGRFCLFAFLFVVCRGRASIPRWSWRVGALHVFGWSSVCVLDYDCQVLHYACQSP